MENIVISKHVKITAMVGELVIMANVIVTLVSYLDIIYIYKVISIRHHWTEFAPRRPFRSAFKNFKSSVLILEADGPIITT